LKIRGDNGLVTIPLAKTKTDETPFQAKSNQEFSSHALDVGKIKKITIEHQGTEKDLLWHLKTVQIKKGNETYE
jgi:predicted metalloprotease with PDZ domain